MLEEAIRKSEKSGGGTENQERDRVIQDVFDKKKMPVFAGGRADRGDRRSTSFDGRKAGAIRPGGRV